MSDNTREMCQQHADSMYDTLTAIWSAYDADEMIGEDGEPTADDADDATDPLEYLQEMPLEIVWEHGTPFAVVFGTGGPHVEIVEDVRHGGPEIAVYWGGEKATARGEAVRRTADYFREMFEEGNL